MTIYDIDSNKTALLIIDAQNEYFSEDGALYTPNGAVILNNLIQLRQIAKKAGLMSILVRQEHRDTGIDVGRMADFDETECFTKGTFGASIIDQLTPDETDIVVTKSRYSAFVNTELESILRGNEVNTVIICGLMTQFCSVTTARHAHDLDYRVIFVSDANAGPDIPDLGYGAIDHSLSLRVILSMLSLGVADIQSTEEIRNSLDTD